MSPRSCPARRGRHRATSRTAAKAIRSIAIPAGPTSSNSVVAIADPNWTDAIPTTTRPVGGIPAALRAGSDLARRLVLVLEWEVLQRVDLAEVGAARFERGADLGLGELGAALDAALLDDRIDRA
jgi:hypothetical protein